MPLGVPVAAVGLDAGENAGILAAQILSIGDSRLAEAIKRYRADLREKVLRDALEVGGGDV
jgi:5-(carboxyamino)imidazole ribonucleotide mutase